MVIFELQGPDNDAEAQCPRPDIVVVNSGMHDVFGGDAVLPAFEKEVESLQHCAPGRPARFRRPEPSG